MNNNATQEDAAASRLFPPANDEENDCISRLRKSRMPDLPEEKEILRRLDQIRYNPSEASVCRILKYAEKTLKNNV